MIIILLFHCCVPGEMTQQMAPLSQMSPQHVQQQQQQQVRPMQQVQPVSHVEEVPGRQLSLYYITLGAGEIILN